MRGHAVIALLLLCLSLGATAGERRELEGAKIKGETAMPKVLFIVPWQNSALGTLPLLPQQSVLDSYLLPGSVAALEGAAPRSSGAEEQE